MFFFLFVYFDFLVYFCKAAIQGMHFKFREIDFLSIFKERIILAKQNQEDIVFILADYFHGIFGEPLVVEFFCFYLKKPGFDAAFF